MAENTLPADLGRAAYEAESAWLAEYAPGRDTPWDALDPEVHEVYERLAGTVAAVERDRIAGQLDALAANYPEDVFPPDSVIRDGISGTAMRHAYRNAARTVREAAAGTEPGAVGPQSTVGDARRAMAGLLGIDPAAILHFAAAIDTEAGFILQFCCDDRQAAADMYADAARGVVAERGEPLHPGGPVPPMPGEAGTEPGNAP